MKKINFNKENKIRLAVLLILPILAVLVLLFHETIASWLAPCWFNTLLGLRCPGCGMTRAVKSLCKFRFVQSFMYNPAALILSVIGFLYYIEHWFLLFGKRVHLFLRNGWVYIVLGILFAIYCILRNIPGLTFLSLA